jgi:hypothetical protein
MKVLQEIALPQPESFYTKPLLFDVKLDGSACGSFLKDGAKFTIDAPTLLASDLALANGTSHKATLETLSSAALRFFRSRNARQFAPAEYISLLFLTRYNWGLAFQESSQGSLRHVPPKVATLHGEAVRTHTEQFAYGLAIDFVATLLGIPTDRFFFNTGVGPRPDFSARVSAEELSSHGIGALSVSGHVVHLEVKARTGWGSYRHKSEGLSLLQDISNKAASKPTCAFLSVIVSLPGKNNRRGTRARIILADPGEPTALEENDQVILLLEESLHLLVRHGLWLSMRSALDWLRRSRGGRLTAGEEDLLKFTEGNRNEIQYRLLRETRNGRGYIGRFFSDVELRLGRFGERGMTKTEAEERVARGDLGRVWYSGADQSWINAVQDQDIESFLRYGIRTEEAGSFVKSAFILEEQTMTEEIAASVLNGLDAALRHW